MINIDEIKEVVKEEFSKELGLEVEKNNKSTIEYFNERAKLSYYPEDDNELLDNFIFYNKFIDDKKISVPELTEYLFDFDNVNNSVAILASLCASLMAEKLQKAGVVVPSIEIKGQEKENIVKKILFPMLDIRENQYLKNLDNTFTGEKDDLALSYGLTTILNNKVTPKFIDVSGELKNLESLTKFEYWGKDIKTNIIRCLSDTNIAELAQSNKELAALAYDKHIRIMINQLKNDGKLWIMKDSEEALKCDYNVLKINLENDNIDLSYFEKNRDMLENFGKALYFETLTTSIDKLENIRDYIKREYKDIKHIDNVICVYAGLKVLMSALDKINPEYYIGEADRLMDAPMNKLQADILQYIENNSI